MGHVSEDEKRALHVLAGVRVTIERLVRRMHEDRGVVDEAKLKADTEAMWTVALEAYRRGATEVHWAMHNYGEGVDHEMLDESFEYALSKLRGKE